ncbi:dihydrofolate reductase family protein [Streptomyces sp. NPDC006733]|uniref:dihydrofolate reductase family protein n=1 Tax=Streptomyces sp. NPDC006733 TaxID=3155460 RepID=UPI0033C58856
MFADAWPGRETAGGEDAPMAKALGDARTIVVSRSALTFTWRNSEQVQGDLLEGVTAPKQENGGPIGRSGSISVVRALLAAGLIDELHLCIPPIAVGQGLRLVGASTEPPSGDS